MQRCPILALLAGCFALLQPPLAAAGPGAEDPAASAYTSLRAGDFDRAVALFRLAIAAHPELAHLHKDLAYTLLKTGEREDARDHFAAALRLNPSDELSALECGFLSFETKRPLEARRIFQKWMIQGSESTRTTAAAAFENIDRPLREAISRWTAAVAAAPEQWSAHEELARWAEQRDEPALAAAHYQKAFELRQDERRLMIDLARVWQQSGKPREALALLLAASRSASPRIAESARELLPERYPYAYEFEDALLVDPRNAELRREFGFFLVELGRNAEARRQFEIQVQAQPSDRLSQNQLRMLTEGEKPSEVRSPAPVPPARSPGSAASSKEIGLKSYYRGYTKDALRYLQSAWEDAPGDPEVALHIARTLNLLHRDREALEWFDWSRQSGVAEIVRDAERAYRNLRPALAPFRYTVWSAPTFSSRWQTVFLYSQAKVQPGHWTIRGVQPYVSLRWIGDTRMRDNLRYYSGSPGAMLSDSAFILSGGMLRYLTQRLFLWFEAGRAFSYLGSNPASGWGQADIRGGASYLNGRGSLGNNGERGWFGEWGLDALYNSRYGEDFLIYGQTRGGYTLPALRGIDVQALWNLNLTTDARRQWWGNLAETGPGVRVRWAGLPEHMALRADFVRGAYLVNTANPRRPNYWDLRTGIWYAFTR